ncbi:MAG TPA: hypothetical protein VI248_02155 [Kineosporiaceae bacterium]
MPETTGPATWPGVTVLLDPHDDVAVTVGLLERHDPDGGLVVVHPTPAVSGLASAAHDVLAGLGRAVNRLTAERLSGEHRAWRAVEAWLTADEIEHLVVLRADRLLPAVWERLMQACHRSGAGLLLVVHVPVIPAALAAVLAGTGHRTLADPALAHRLLTAGQRPLAPAVDAQPDGVHPRAEDRGRRAPVLIGEGLVSCVAPGFGRGRHQAGQWLAARDQAEPGIAAGIAEVQLLLAGLVQSSVDLDGTQAVLAGARSAFADHGFDLRLPGPVRLPEPGTRSLRGHLYGPGLPRPYDLLDHAAVARIRAGVANPVLAAGIAAALLSQLPTQTLHSLPWQALSQDERTLRLSHFHTASLLQPTPWTNPDRPRYTMVLPVPAPARALFRAARHFSDHGDALPHRMFAATRFSSLALEAAAANCGIRLPDQPDMHEEEFRTLHTAWPARITCTRTASNPHRLAPAPPARARPAMRAVLRAVS